MKHNLYKLLLCTAIVMLFIKPGLAQQNTSACQDMPATRSFRLEEKIENLDLKLQGLAVKLDKKVFNKIDPALLDLHVKLTDKFNKLDINIPEPDIKVYDFQNYGPQNNFTGVIEEKSKTISKTYTVDANDKLDINNQFGKVTVNTWAKNQIKVDVEIKAYESTESKAQNLLNGVSVTEARQGNIISFITGIEHKTSNWWAVTGGGNDDRRGVQVNYTVYMPSKNPLNVTNKYGSTVLPRLDGAVNINNSYGSFSAVALNNPANQIKVTYGSARITNFSAGNINVAYGSLSIEDAVRLNADVSKGSIKIGRLNGGGVLESKYGSVKIDEIGQGIKNLTINSSYGGVSLGINDEANFGFDVTVSYGGGFSFNDSRLDINSTTPDDSEKGFNPTKNYKGQCGKDSDSKILIKTRYGGVKFL